MDALQPLPNETMSQTWSRYVLTTKFESFPPEIVEKVLHLRKTYHLGPMRIVWYLARYHDIKISGAGVSR